MQHLSFTKVFHTDANVAGHCVFSLLAKAGSGLPSDKRP